MITNQGRQAVFEASFYVSGQATKQSRLGRWGSKLRISGLFRCPNHSAFPHTAQSSYHAPDPKTPNNGRLQAHLSQSAKIAMTCQSQHASHVGLWDPKVGRKPFKGWGFEVQNSKSVF